MRSWLVIPTLLNIVFSFPWAVNGSSLLLSDVSKKETISNATTNATILASTTQRAHVLKALHISCDGSRYGWDLSERSCIDILTVMEEDPHMRTFGPRGLGPWDFPLPQRLVSSKPLIRSCFDRG